MEDVAKAEKSEWSWGQMTFRLGVSLLSMGGILTLLALSGIVFWLWYLSLGVMGCLYVLSYVAPEKMERAISNPYVFQWKHNIGPDSLEFQAVIYDAYHTNWYSRLSHEAGWLFESIGWLVVMYAWLGPWGIFLILGIVWWQVYSFGEHPMSMMLMGIWLLLATLSYSLVGLLGAQLAYTAAVYTIVGFSLWRFVGHSIGPIPAGIIDNKFYRYTWQVLSPRLFFPVLLGYFAEFASGLPFRLPSIWLYMVLQKWVGYQPNTTISIASIEGFSNGILEHGWKAHPVSEKIFLKDQPLSSQRLD